MEIGLRRIPGQRLKGGLGPQQPWRPIRLRIQPPKQPKQRPAQTQRQARPQTLFHQMQPVAPIAAKTFIATITGQRHSDMAAGELADPIGGNGRAVGIGFIVQPGQGIDQVEIIAIDGIDKMPGLVAIGDLLREMRFVKGRVAEGDRAGIDRPGRQAGHQRHHRAGIDATG